MKELSLRFEKKYWRQGFRYIAGLDEVGRGCEKADAEVLTSNDWKFYTDINFKKDKVLSYTNAGFMRWQKIEKVIEKDFKGNLIEFRNRGIKIVVTPNHYFTVLRRVSKRDKKDNNRLKLVGYKVREERKIVTDLSSNDFIPRGGKWKGINRNFFKLPKVDRNEEKLIDIKLWVAFLGIFLSEGSTSYYKKKGLYRVFISQSKNAFPSKYKKIYCLLKKLPFRFHKFKTGFGCCNKQLYTYLKQFGNCYNKFIPKDIKELSPPLLNILINWMILGDGACYIGENRKKVCVYYTVSKKLKDDFEEVLLKARWTYHTSVRAPREGCIEGRIIKRENQAPCFEIRLRRNNKVHIKFLHKKKVFYKGKVFCLQLPKYHNFYVRRNGTGYFTGNSLAGPIMAAAVIFDAKSFKRINGVNDSKLLTASKREKLFVLIKENCLCYQVARVNRKIIDKAGINKANELVFKKAIKKLRIKPNLVLADGQISLKNLKIPYQPIIKADRKIFSVAAASILAKVSRDNLMKKLDKKHSFYKFGQNKGYGTKEHYLALKKHGPCPCHRRSFRLK